MKYEQLRHEPSWEERLNDLRLLAATQPVTSFEDNRQRHEQFRDSYFERFPEIQRVRQGNAPDEEVFYVRMVMERFGYDLIRFYDENESLCEAICDAVIAKAPYDRLALGYHELSAAEIAGEVSLGSAQSLQESIDHPLGIEAIGIYYWDQLNPLLEQAYQLMDTQTLNAPFLTK